MKNLLIIVLSILSVACGQTKTEKENNSTQVETETKTEKNKKIENEKVTDRYEGTYEYVYPYNTETLIENNYIIITKSEMNYSGLYYGTSDEFDDSREGYYPGFFVTKMNNLIITGDTISFSLYVEYENIFDKAVDLKYKSAKEAKEAGYQKWIQVLKFEPKEYKGIFKNDTIFFKGDFLDKEFIKK